MAEAAEERCNEAIRRAEGVTVKMCQLGDPELDEVRIVLSLERNLPRKMRGFVIVQSHTRGLPEDFSGPVRIICIGDSLDRNLCCGTHVSNLAQLQAVKILGWERAKKSQGRTNLQFLVGGRALRYLAACRRREENLTGVLNGGPEDHAALAEKMARNLKLAQKSLQGLAKELAARDAREINEDKENKFFVIHR